MVRRHLLRQQDDRRLLGEPPAGGGGDGHLPAGRLPAAYALVRLKPPGAEALGGLFTAPLLLPTIVLGLAILLVFAPLGLLGTFQGLVVAHIIVTLP